MSIFVIGDLHLSFSVDKPMDIFGLQWQNYMEKIKNNWINKVKETDTVILPSESCIINAGILSFVVDIGYGVPLFNASTHPNLVI